jgi:hypothetical protein
LDETLWLLTSPRVKRISGSKNFRSAPQKDFRNSICHEQTWSDRRGRQKKSRPKAAAKETDEWPFDEISSLTRHNSNAQERRRNGGGVVVRAFVLAVEQTFQFRLQITGSTVLFSSLERIHGWPIIFSECINEL